MPQGKGTYGNKVGRPPKKSNGGNSLLTKNTSFLPDNRDYEGIGRWSEEQIHDKAQSLASHNVKVKHGLKKGKVDYFPTISNVHKEEDYEGRKKVRTKMQNKVRGWEWNKGLDKKVLIRGRDYQ
jgi:hypothetical protein